MTVDEIARVIDHARRCPSTRGITGDALVSLADLLTEREQALDNYKRVTRSTKSTMAEMTTATIALKRAEDNVRRALNYKG